MSGRVVVEGFVGDVDCAVAGEVDTVRQRQNHLRIGADSAPIEIIPPVLGSQQPGFEIAGRSRHAGGRHIEDFAVRDLLQPRGADLPELRTTGHRVSVEEATTSGVEFQASTDASNPAPARSPAKPAAMSSQGRACRRRTQLRCRRIVEFGRKRQVLDLGELIAALATFRARLEMKRLGPVVGSPSAARVSAPSERCMVASSISAAVQSLRILAKLRRR